MTNPETMLIDLDDTNVGVDIDGATYDCAECHQQNIPLTYGDDFGLFYVFAEPQILEVTDKGIICEGCSWEKEQK